MAKHASQLNISLSVKDFAWETGLVLRGVTCNRRGKGWLLVVRAENSKGHPKVAFSEGDTPQEALDHLLMMAGGRYAKQYWLKDKYSNR